MDEFLTLVETRKITQRGERGGATLLPYSFMEKNNLYRGTKLSLAMTADMRSLVIVTPDTTVTFIKEPLVVAKKYNLGMHVIRGKAKDNSYPIVTLPQRFLLQNDLKPGDVINIFETPQDGVLVIRKREDDNAN